MLVQDIDYFGDKVIPCSSSGYHRLTTDDYYKYLQKEEHIIHIPVDKVDKL